MVKNYSTYLGFQQRAKEQDSPSKIMDKPWEVIGADSYTMNHGNFYLCVVVLCKAVLTSYA